MVKFERRSFLEKAKQLQKIQKIAITKTIFYKIK
jgi:hypothetical protein